MPGKVLMVQGTASDVGKSVIVAALGRILTEDDFRVAPFKAQNMALNSFVTPEGGEIGRAQAMQAEACKIEAHVDMNPILMKPYEDTKAQIIFLGKPAGNMSVSEYAIFKEEIFPQVMERLNALRQRFDLVVIEGAGSPAEINLGDQDIVNMKIAEAAEAPVILVGDIDRGGVFAALIGTLELLKPNERNRISAFLINKFRGDASLLNKGIEFLQKRTGKPTLGIIPFIKDLRIAQEDTLSTFHHENSLAEKLSVRIVLLQHLSNFTDFDALRNEPDVDLRYVRMPQECSAADLLIIPGSKSTVADFLDLKSRGFVEFLRSKGANTTLLGICAGYQMLGQRILDRHAVESEIQEVETFGMIRAVTIFDAEKCTRQVSGKLMETDLAVRGYEIHHGTVQLQDLDSYFFLIHHQNGSMRGEGYSNSTESVYGTSIHGIFDEPEFRRWFLNRVREKKGLAPLKINHLDPDVYYRDLAAHVRKNIDMSLLYRIINREL